MADIRTDMKPTPRTRQSVDSSSGFSSILGPLTPAPNTSLVLEEPLVQSPPGSRENSSGFPISIGRVNKDIDSDAFSLLLPSVKSFGLTETRYPDHHPRVGLELSPMKSSVEQFPNNRGQARSDISTILTVNTRSATPPAQKDAGRPPVGVQAPPPIGRDSELLDPRKLEIEAANDSDSTESDQEADHAVPNATHANVDQPVRARICTEEPAPMVALSVPASRPPKAHDFALPKRFHSSGSEAPPMPPRPTLGQLKQSGLVPSQSAPTVLPGAETEGASQDNLATLLKKLAVPIVTASKTDGSPVNGGAFADVWRGLMTPDNRPVALKVLRLHLRGTDSHRVHRAIAREVSVWARLHDKNVLRFLGVRPQDDGNSLWLVSPWMEKGDVKTYLTNNPNINRFSLASGVTSGVAYLHKNNIVHGDLKANNILVTSDGQPQLADFGLSVVLDDVLPEQTTSTMFAGSVRWMSPERIQPAKFGLTHASCRTLAGDVHSLAMTLWEIFALRLPYHELTQMDVPRAIVAGERPPHPGETADAVGFTSELWEFIQKCWVEGPNERPKLAEHLDDGDDGSDTEYGTNQSVSSTSGKESSGLKEATSDTSVQLAVTTASADIPVSESPKPIPHPVTAQTQGLPNETDMKALPNLMTTPGSASIIANVSPSSSSSNETQQHDADDKKDTPTCLSSATHSKEKATVTGRPMLESQSAQQEIKITTAVGDVGLVATPRQVEEAELEPIEQPRPVQADGHGTPRGPSGQEIVLNQRTPSPENNRKPFRQRAVSQPFSDQPDVPTPLSREVMSDPLATAPSSIFGRITPEESVGNTPRQPGFHPAFESLWTALLDASQDPHSSKITSPRKESLGDVVGRKASPISIHTPRSIIKERESAEERGESPKSPRNVAWSDLVSDAEVTPTSVRGQPSKWEVEQPARAAIAGTEPAALSRKPTPPISKASGTASDKQRLAPKPLQPVNVSQVSEDMTSQLIVPFAVLVTPDVDKKPVLRYARDESKGDENPREKVRSEPSSSIEEEVAMQPNKGTHSSSHDLIDLIDLTPPPAAETETKVNAVEVVLEGTGNLIDFDSDEPTSIALHQEALDPFTGEVSDVVIDNLDLTIDLTGLKRLFEPYGEILDVNITMDQRGIPLGRACVTFADHSDAQRAVKEMNKKMIRTQRITAMVVEPAFSL